MRLVELFLTVTSRTTVHHSEHSQSRQSSYRALIFKNLFLPMTIFLKQRGCLFVIILSEMEYMVRSGFGVKIHLR